MSSEGEEGKLPPVDHDPLNEGAVGKTGGKYVMLICRAHKTNTTANKTNAIIGKGG